MGCPHHGYIDWLHVFDDLGPNTVIIKTVDYYIYSTFTNGLRQGKGFSCPVATVVAAYVVDKWIKNVHREPGLEYGNDRDDLAYVLHTKHPADPTTPTVTANSYCDDDAKAFGVTYDVSNGDFGVRMARARAAEKALGVAFLLSTTSCPVDTTRFASRGVDSKLSGCARKFQNDR